MSTCRPALIAFSLAAIFLAGCGYSTSSAPVAGGASALMRGKVMGGQQPVLGSLVSVVAVGTTGYGSASTVLASVVSSPIDGSFSFPAGAYTCPYAATPVYLLAQGGDAGGGVNTSIALAAGIGACSGATAQQVNINEVTTVATAYALGQFFTTTLGSTDDFGANAPSTGTYSQGLVYANSYTIPTLVNLPYGTVNPSTSSLTIEAAKIYSIANTLAACVNSSGATGASDICGELFTDTTPPGATQAPTDTLQAAVQMSLYPYQNVAALFDLASPTAPFVGLVPTPNDLTVGVSYTTTNLGLGILGTTTQASSSNIDIDASGRVWMPSNQPGAVGVAYFDPTSNTFSGAFSDGSLNFPQYVAIDFSGEIWATDLGGNYFESINTQTYIPDFVGYFDDTTITDGPVGIDYDNTVYFSTIFDGGAYLTDVETDRQTIDGGTNSFDAPPTGLTPLADGGFPDYFISTAASGDSTPCYLDASINDSNNGNAYGYFAITGNTCESGGTAITAGAADLVSVATTLNQICSADDGTCFAPGAPVNLPEGIATDGRGALWLANSGDGSVSTMNDDYSQSSPVEYTHNSTNGNTMSAPYGLAIDNSGNVWVSNAGCIDTSGTGCTATSFTLSELIGAAAPTITPLSAQGAGTSQGTLPEVAKNSSGIAVKHRNLLEKQKASGLPKLAVTRLR